MTYLGALLAQARQADVAPDRPASTALRPVLPARFEPVAPLEVTTTVEAIGPVGALPTPTSTGWPEVGRQPAADSEPALPAEAPAVASDVRSRPTDQSPMPAARRSPAPEREAVQPATVTPHVDAADQFASPVRAIPADAPPREVATHRTPLRERSDRPPTSRSSAPDSRDLAAVRPAPDNSAVRDAGPLRPAPTSDDAPVVALPGPRDAPPGIRVSIGRVEVRAPAAPPTPPAGPRWSPRLSLDDYLRERSR